jgi:hypothetical protein
MVSAAERKFSREAHTTTSSFDCTKPSSTEASNASSTALVISLSRGHTNGVTPQYNRNLRATSRDGVAAMICALGLHAERISLEYPEYVKAMMLAAPVR